MRLGYANPDYFSRVFKKVLAESPSSYMSHFYQEETANTVFGGGVSFFTQKDKKTFWQRFH
jgi:hypothetical protein